MAAPEPHWAAALRPGPHTTGYEGPLTLSHREIGRLRLPTGRIVAGDPLADPGVQPFARTLEPGEYPVRLAIGRLASGEELLAAAWVAFSDAPVVTWLGATFKGSGTTPKFGKAIAHIVDSGHSAFLSPEAATVLVAKLEDDDYSDAIYELIRANPSGDAAVLSWPEHPTLNAVVFSTDSDGVYPSYWGDDAAGRPVVLLTDFGLLEPRGGATPPKPWWKFW